MGRKTSIRKKVLTFSLVFFIVFLIGGGAAFFTVISNIVRSDAESELAALVELERTAITGEVDKQLALASQMSNSAVIQDYLRNPNDEEKLARAFAEFETYSKTFNSPNLFWASDVRNDDNEITYYFAMELAYSFSEDAPDDQWYVTTRNSSAPYMFNIDSNPKSGTRLWINAKAMDGSEFLGIVGIGAELTAFFDTIYENVDPNLYDLYFFDAQGAITGAEDTQLAEDKAPIVDQLSYGQRLLDASKNLAAGKSTVIRDGSREIGLINIESIGWTMAVVTEITALAYLTNIITVLFAVIILVVLLVICIFYIFISRGIISPLLPIAAAADRIATGDVNVNISQSSSDDEIGTLQKSMIHLLATMRAESEALENIASGDLTIKYVPLSEQDAVGNSLVKLLERNSETFTEIRLASDQVSGGAQHIADGAQALAQGTAAQAAAIRQLSVTINEIASETKESSEMATNAETLSVTIKGNAERGSAQMNAMIDAVREINEASQSIQNVIKVIDDIAFQTNILALNAAVEAARAGQQGKGFAVVAEEVRSLAAKSAAAASDTGALIENSMEKALLGSRIAKETAASLTEIVSGINESTKIISDIAKLSEEQSLAIGQITSGIDQVARVVQENAAVSQESAASSEEMASQSAILLQNVAKFKLNDERRRITDGNN
ncbi:MAG: methyl-accepting chemotaxis protein [Oscillospiraceae bacterium]|jgi:methyl-accepting chemotaxis protein|nr:methyl-accepting chemotaxis protein [Oscillospiraceae bacterium]